MKFRGGDTWVPPGLRGLWGFWLVMSDLFGTVDRMKLFTRYRILNAARAMVGEVGVERVTMRGIAARANITAAAIYKHFLNKRALLDEVIASGFSELATEMLAANDEQSGDAGLRTAIGRIFEFAEIHPKLTRMMMAPQTDDSQPIQRLAAQIARCMRERTMPFGNQDVVARMFWAQVRGQLAMRPDRSAA